MKHHLRHIRDWEKLAEKSNWSASILAMSCGVSLRTLQRYFVKRFGKQPKGWLLERRHSRAIEILSSGQSVKEVATILGYRHASTFSREFAKYWRSCRVEQIKTSELPPKMGGELRIK